MADQGTYVVRYNVASPTNSATLPALQLTLSANRRYILQRVSITQETTASSPGVAAVEIVRSTATAPGTLANAGNAVILARNSRERAITAAVTVQTSGFSGSLTGTQETMVRKGFNIYGGLEYAPTLYEWDEISGTDLGYLWVRFPLAMPAQTYNIELNINEQ